MFKLGPTGLKWMKGVHLCAVCSWVGGAISLVLLHFLKQDVSNSGVLYGVNQSIHHVDMVVVVIPGAFGCLLTGLCYGLFTRWGFFKQGWMIFKWILTVSAIIFGTICLGPWEVNMMEISGALGLEALTNQDYLYNQRMNLIFGSVQACLLVITVFISIFKPWKRARRD